jgi:hypothetical protein
MAAARALSGAARHAAYAASQAAVVAAAQQLHTSGAALQTTRSTQAYEAVSAQQVPTAADYALIPRRRPLWRRLLAGVGRMLWQICRGLFRLAGSCMTAPVRLWNIVNEIWGAEARSAVVRLTLLLVLAAGGWFTAGSWLSRLATDAPAIERGTQAAAESSASAPPSATSNTQSPDSSIQTCGSARVTGKRVN